MIDIRDNWRVLMLVVLCILAALALFGPLGAGSGTPDFGSNDSQAETLTTTTTDANGEYEIEMPVGDFEMHVDDWAYEDFTTNVTVEGNETSTVDITLTPRETGSVAGTVTSQEQSQEGVTVSFLDRSTGESVHTAETDDSGEYSADIPTGEYQVEVDEVDLVPATRNITVSTGATETVDFDLGPRETGGVTGAVSDGESPLTGIDVEIIEPGEGIVTVETTGADGAFNATLPVGEYDLRVDAVAYEFFETGITVDSNQTTTANVSLVPQESGTIAGTVRADNASVAGVELDFTELGTQETVATVTTDESGEYEQTLPVGEYDLAIESLRYDELTTTVAVELGETTTRDVTLTPVEMGTVTGTVTDESGAALSDVELGFGESQTIDQSVDSGFTDPTNLQYGLDLSGGARIRGQLVGMTAEDVGLNGSSESEIQRSVAEALGLDPIDVRVRTNLDAVEVFDGSVSSGEFANALQEAGLDVSEDDVRGGVTSVTRGGAVDTLTERVDQTGLSGADVFTTSGVTGENFIVAEVPGITLGELRDIISEPGRVQIIAGYPGENGSLVTREVLTTEDFAGIQAAQQSETGSPPNVPVTLNSEAAQRYADLMRDAGFTTEGIGNCFFDESVHNSPREGEHCLYTVVDGEYVYGASMSEDLAGTINNEQFVASPTFQMQTGSYEQAQQLEINLRAGELPTEIEVSSESFISPSLAQLFKPLALLTALIAWLVVSAIVYYWYRDIRVAVPMLATAGAEVFLLLGFAAFVGLALDLSHIAGLIAVIGTGLDDLIIMADEILQRKQDVKTGRVFQSRFRKAFWVIGMAAATTIVAMSPLAVLSLGDLQGFAIVTIVGVLIGVGVSRPAYGDILRHLMLDDVKRTGK